MMNINSIFMAPKIREVSSISWMSVLFVFNSIYNILDYLCILNDNRAKQINYLQETLNKTNKKCDELQKKYHELYINFEKLNKKIINILNLKNNELQDIKIDELNIETSVVYRELCESYNHNDTTTKTHTNNAEVNSEDINNEFIESLSLDYDCNENTETNENLLDICNRVRTRSSSLTETWTTLTKRFFFG